jgi:RimJ/RimL family protein N-acetyltransferase
VGADHLGEVGVLLVEPGLRLRVVRHARSVRWGTDRTRAIAAACGQRLRLGTTASVPRVTVPPTLPPWPPTPPAHGPVVLRQLSAADLPMVLDLATDPYVPLIGTLPAHATDEEAAAWIERNRGRWAEGRGFSFAVAEAATDRAVGALGLWLAELPYGRGEIGYSVMPSARGRGLATAALVAGTEFAWTIPGLHRLELHIEPWNTASIRTAERAGYQREGLLRSHQEIGGLRRDMLLYAAVRPG